MQSKQMQAQVSSTPVSNNHNQIQNLTTRIFDYLKTSSQPHPFGQLNLKNYIHCRRDK